MSTTTYNSRQVILTWGSIPLTDGALSEGPFLEVAPTARRATQTGLMGGGAVVAILNSTLGTCTVTLSSAAAVNDQLTTALQQQIDTGIPVIGALMAKDHSGRTVVTCNKALLDGCPTISYSETAPTYQWIFLCPDLKIAANGGNEL